MTTYYTLPDGRHTSSYEHWRAACAAHTDAQAAFDARFGAALSTPEGRRAAIETMRAGALDKSRTVTIAPAAPQFQGGLTEAEVSRRVDVAMTGTVNRHGAVAFPIPEARGAALSDADGSLPPGAVRISFFGGMPQS